MRFNHLSRREVITLIGGAIAAWPLTAHAQQEPAKSPRIGIIDDAPIWDHFRQGLRDLGYIDGQSIAIEYSRRVASCGTNVGRNAALRRGGQFQPIRQRFRRNDAGAP